MIYTDCAIVARLRINLNQDNCKVTSHGTGKVEGVETIVIDDSESESDDNDDSVASEYSMPNLRMKNDDDASGEESSNNEYDEESENYADNLSIVEDVINDICRLCNGHPFVN